MAPRQTAVVAGAALALALAVSGPALGGPGAEGRRAGGLAGRLLVARPEMNDPRFARAVVYMVRHDAEGALGLVVNRPLGEVPMAQLMGRLGLEHEGVKGSLRLHYGGPVEPGRVFVLHTTDWRGQGTQVLGGGIAMTDPRGILPAIGSGAGPRRALVIFAYSGWGPGQLEREIRAGGWFSVPADPSLVLDDAHDTKWDRAMARREIDL